MIRLLPAACLFGLLLAPTYAELPRREQLLQQMLRQGSSFLRYGDCVYSWKWRKSSTGGVYTSTYTCDNSEIVDDSIAVSCTALKVNYYHTISPLGVEPPRYAWSGWQAPMASEARLVADLCSQQGY